MDCLHDGISESQSKLELISKSIEMSQNNIIKNKQNDYDSKLNYLTNSVSEEYIVQYICAEMDFDTAVRRGIEEHLEDLMTQMYHMEHSDHSDSASLKSEDSGLSIKSIKSTELNAIDD